MGCNSSKLEITPETDRSSQNEKQADSEFLEGVVCQIQDLKENEMKTVELEEHKVLLVKQNGKISALGSKCTHYGAPLVSGALGDGRIRCQWHGACFNLETGDIEDFPGMDSLPCYKVTVEDGNVKVRAKRAELISNKRVKSLGKKSHFTRERFVVIGGGPSGATAVEALRQEGFTGEIDFVMKENYLPYDRVKVSKQMDFDIIKAQFRDDQFYKNHDINVLKGVAATAVDTSNKSVSLSNGQEIKYDKLYIATGCNPRKPPCPGNTAKNVCIFKDYEDAAYVYPKLTPETEVVVVGSSFIGMEAASYVVNKVKSVTVIGRGAVPFRSSWGNRIGAAILKMFEGKGVKYVANSGIKTINENEQGAVSSVELTDGTILKCDFLFCGIGSNFATDFLEGSGINVRPDGSVEVNEYLQTNIADVYVGGDIAYAPVWSHHNQKSAIGHYGLAQYHGRSAALNMIGKPTPIKAVPYFWTMLFGKGFRYAGHGKYDDIVYAGDVEELKFMAFFLDGDEVIAVLSCGMDPLVSKFAELLAQDKKLYRADLKDDPLAWTK
ncbi:apoptosis-inducing factor 3-like isoform X2 [Anthonomus grandis grandis]|uniref:apoptosis-inducing factor 3-like isoform X2 n=1 Tax=Anthonomus grandis grandis TaxID=2921223 RepID=UPI0021665589|nr:apoptosis-inducing factor 3-like isoform X2 [Anthonomus grandis grandis]